VENQSINSEIQLMQMKENVQFSWFLTLILIVFSFNHHAHSQEVQGVTGATVLNSKTGNSLYHKTDEKSLTVSELYIEGEIENPGKTDLNRYYKREIILKESALGTDNEIAFIGAFRYKGYSLFDLLNPHVLKKKNVETFRPPIDLYVVIENDKRESVVFSWSEIFQTNILHQIIIATEVAPIKSYRKDTEYKTGDQWKVVCAADLYSNRTLENPVRITVRSFEQKQYVINRDVEPLFSPEIRVEIDQDTSFIIPSVTDRTQLIRYNTSFFGMGMGYHGNKSFEGIALKSFLENSGYTFQQSWVRNGLVCAASVDGYRAVFSFSELFNRYDQVGPILSLSEKDEKSGFFRFFLPTDFYADRSVKAVKELYFFKI